ncbi:MAG TPA: FecR domain-containing protein [Polyangiaceae bacterium]|jgi:ferric-dicitrate binding protein FerR (iron transport regulator)|nr:FecR domain-containing protein [Polyangiaceae bacterium]
MTAPEYARLASRMFFREENTLAEEPPTPEARTEAIAAIADAIAARGRKRRALRWMAWVGTAGAAAAVAIGVVGFVRFEARHAARAPAGPPVASAPGVQITAHPMGGVASLVVSGSQAPLADGRSLAEGSRLVTPPDGRANLAFSTGTSVLVGEGTDVMLGGEGATQVLRLNSGWIDLHVAKLADNQKFLVDTPDAEVEVRGTRFRVLLARADASCGSGTMTRVVVSEGVVVVRHANVESSVSAGEQWPLGCAAAPASTSAAASRMQDSAGASLASSTLADQNDLFGEGLAHKRRGEVKRALASFDRFLDEYPTSALAESAMVERMRLFRSSSSSRAPQAAKRYLATYPDGFAHGEAEAILAGSP